MERPNPEPIRPAGPGDDPFAGLAQRLSVELMQLLQRTPALLEAMLEGREGPIELSAEHQAEITEKATWILLDHLPNIASAVDLTRGQLVQLTRRVEGIERRLGGRHSG